MNKYFLYAQIGKEKVEREVTLEEYCAAERKAGFYPKMNPSNSAYVTTPATGGFSSGLIGGRIETARS